jgi:hypothetical protein
VTLTVTAGNYRLPLVASISQAHGTVADQRLARPARQREHFGARRADYELSATYFGTGRL